MEGWRTGEGWAAGMRAGGVAGVMGRSGENGDGGMERKVGLNGVGWMRRWLLLRVWVCDILEVTSSGEGSLCVCMCSSGVRSASAEWAKSRFACELKWFEGIDENDSRSGFNLPQAGILLKVN